MKKIFKYILITLTSILFAFNLFASQNESLKIGSSEAKITVKVFSSLTCPHCAAFHKNIFEKLKKEYINNNIVKFEHHSFPLDLAALNAEKILRCADSPEVSFNLLNEIYEKQNKWAIGSDINKINLNKKKYEGKHEYELLKKQIEKLL